MKRIGWLILLISLGLNLGLGWRLMSQLRSQPADWSEGRSWRQGPGRGFGGPGGGIPKQQRRNFFRPAPGDSGAWREVMATRLERITQRLDLNQRQVESFRATHLQAASRFRGQRILVEAAEDRLFALASGNPVEPDSIRAAVRDLGRRKARLDSLVTETMLKELDSLNPGQRELYLRILPWSRPGGVESGPPGRRQHHKSEPSPGINGE